LAFVQKLPENFIVIALEITEGQADTFLVDPHQSIQIIIFWDLLSFW